MCIKTYPLQKNDTDNLFCLTPPFLDYQPATCRLQELQIGNQEEGTGKLVVFL